MDKDKLLDRELYRRIKSMNRDDMENTLRRMYQMGYDAALASGTVDLDMEKLRADISQIKGIGQSRLEEIIAVIENNLKSGESEDTPNDE